MPRITDVVKHLIIINIIIYFGSTVLLQSFDYRMLYMWPIGTQYFEPYQLISHMFMHGSGTHLLFNMIGLFFFGPPLESLWGPKKFLFYYLVCGFGALGIHILATITGMQALAPVVGASGAIYGLLAGFGLLFPDAKLALLFFPVPVKAKYFIPGLLALDLFGGILGGFSIFSSGLAHFAHIGGAIFGFIMIMYWRKFGSFR